MLFRCILAGPPTRVIFDNEVSETPVILILSGQGDTHAGKVQAELERRGIKAGRLDPDSFPGLSGISLSLTGAGVLEGSIGPGGGPVQIEDIHAVYCGRPTTSHPVLDELWDALDVGVVPGTPSIVERSFDMDRQKYFATRVGFETFSKKTDPHAYVSRVRVVVAGYRVFAASLGFSSIEPLSLNMWDPCIDSEGISAAVIPVSMAERCREMVEEIGLEFATLDLAVGPDGKALFCGLNPFGHFACIEDKTGLPITRAVADLLLTEAGVVYQQQPHPSSPRRQLPFLRVARGRR